LPETDTRAQIAPDLRRINPGERGWDDLSPYDSSPVFDEIESADDLRDADKVATDLRAIDWAFTSEETGYLTHDLHPYPAKFIPQIPGRLISRLSLRGELILDPFGGSGTTALEAIRLGRRALSVDANAVGTLIGRAKTANLDQFAITDLHSIRSALTTLLVDLPGAERLCAENQEYVPKIPNIDRWFPITSRGELAGIRSRINLMESATGRDVALLALSRIILPVSFQDSETRYTSKPREIPSGETIRRFLAALGSVVRNVTGTEPALRYGVCDFVTADSRQLDQICKIDSVDLIVTSPPYANANDYHLYHRFRLFWLGHDPRELAHIEIGSHLRHQKESSAFDSYLEEIGQSLSGMYRALKPGRYAVLIVGDAIYNRVLHPGAESVSEVAREVGFENHCVIDRMIHRTKRSFVAAGRRATTEKLLVLRKPSNSNVSVEFHPPPYRLWPYEAKLRCREIEAALNVKLGACRGNLLRSTVDPYTLTKARNLVFTHWVKLSGSVAEPTWQAIIENGFGAQPSARKDPKYVTHGLHQYKGKFYPQLARGLINLCDLKSARIFDPFCGSGTTLLEGYLNGQFSIGCDMNPLAAKIASAKVGILEVNPDVVREAVGTLVNRLEKLPKPLPREREQFEDRCLDEIGRWFPPVVVFKLNWLLRSIRGVSEGVVRDFFEVVLSSIIRSISQQDPHDLRIRRRKEPIDDADVIGLFIDMLNTQYERLERFWRVRGYSPSEFKPCKVVEGDSRDDKTFEVLGLENSSVDLILTSPPYATALPYIDTDRLSLLAIFGMDASMRRPVEHDLVGSREILTGERRALENELSSQSGLPNSVINYLNELHSKVSNSAVGFRRKNMPALLLRFFRDMDTVIHKCCRVLRPGGEAMLVVGDNQMQIDGSYERIPTTDFVEAIACTRGLELVERIDISVTTENLVHAKNAIRENVVLRLKRPLRHAAIHA
jgi:DNA modification methylase